MVGGDVYSGHGLGRKLVGTIENGTVYSGQGMNRDIVGTFENGTVYTGFGLGARAIGSATSVADAAALLLLPLPTADEYYAPQPEHHITVGAVPASEGAALLVVLVIMLFLMFVFGALLFWPVLFSKQGLSDPDTPVYLPVTLVSIAIGILAAVRFLKKRTFKPMLAASTTVTTVLLSIAVFVLDPSFKPTDIAFLALFALFACALPSFILSRIFRKKGR